MTYENACSIVFAAGGVFLIIVGRVLSIDLTEGQAFIEYWYIWLMAIMNFLAAIYAAYIGEKKYEKISKP